MRKQPIIPMTREELDTMPDHLVDLGLRLGYLYRDEQQILHERREDLFDGDA